MLLLKGINTFSINGIHFRRKDRQTDLHLTDSHIEGTSLQFVLKFESQAIKSGPVYTAGLMNNGPFGESLVCVLKLFILFFYLFVVDKRWRKKMVDYCISETRSL